MTRNPSSGIANLLVCGLLAVLGLGLAYLGWLVPSRLKSVPSAVAREAGAGGPSLADAAETQLSDGNLGAAALLLEAAKAAGADGVERLERRLEERRAASPLIARWGVWDPFLESGLEDIPLGAYADEPGALGLFLSKETSQAMRALLAHSRNPLVKGLLETGRYTTYRRLSPVDTASGRPLEATILLAGVLAQGERFQEQLSRELRDLVLDAEATGAIGALEDFYLNLLSLGRMLDFGQLKELVGRADSAETLSRLRFAFHRSSDRLPVVYAAALAAEAPGQAMDYLGKFGEDGLRALEEAFGFGVESAALLMREQLPLESVVAEGRGRDFPAWQTGLAVFALRQPALAFACKAAAYFAGSYLLFWAAGRVPRFYGEPAPPALALLPRLFGAYAGLVVLVVLGEPYLAAGKDFDGYSFEFVMPVLAQVDGETQIVETKPKTAMDQGTLLSIAFFFALQAIVFLICMLKVRDIDRRPVDRLVKLKLMENEDNLFDTGLYVGIAGTCVSLVMQVLGLIEANLLAAYSSNLFGILCVAIVKIRLVRPYKNRLIMESQQELAKALKVAV